MNYDLSEIYKELDKIDLIDDEIVRNIIYKYVINLKNKNDNINLLETQNIIDEIFNKIRKYDILQPLIEDKSISEIMVNGYKNIFIEKNGIIEKLNLEFESEEFLVSLVQKMVSKVNRTVNTSNPIVDARLSDGSRINVVLPPISLNGTILTIRKFSPIKFSLNDYVEMNCLTEEAVIDLKKMVNDRCNIFISGGTSSGKTTFLNALSKEIDLNQRIITIEDSAELQLEHIINWVRLETRNSSSSLSISIRDLIKTSLRMRPDRIIVGEVRGEEAIDMLQAMNTGHDGSLSTAHANSIKDMLTRLETMVYSATPIPLNAIRKQICSAIDIMIHLEKDRFGKRKVVEIAQIIDIKNDEIQMLPLYKINYKNIDGRILEFLEKENEYILKR